MKNWLLRLSDQLGNWAQAHPKAVRVITYLGLVALVFDLPLWLGFTLLAVIAAWGVEPLWLIIEEWSE